MNYACYIWYIFCVITYKYDLMCIKTAKESNSPIKNF